MLSIVIQLERQVTQYQRIENQPGRNTHPPRDMGLSPLISLSRWGSLHVTSDHDVPRTMPSSRPSQKKVEKKTKGRERARQGLNEEGRWGNRYSRVKKGSMGGVSLSPSDEEDDKGLTIDVIPL